jgi:hypothetical protein
MVKRTLTIVMNSTVQNHKDVEQLVKSLTGAEVKKYQLSRLPNFGEMWQDEQGIKHTLLDNQVSGTSYIFKAGNLTYDANGSWGGRVFDSHHLIRPIAPSKFKVGDYWKDRIGNVHLISKVDRDHPIFVIEARDGFTWTDAGYYFANGRNDADLITRVTLCECNE